MDSVAKVKSTVIHLLCWGLSGHKTYCLSPIDQSIDWKDVEFCVGNPFPSFLQTLIMLAFFI